VGGGLLGVRRSDLRRQPVVAGSYLQGKPGVPRAKIG